MIRRCRTRLLVSTTTPERPRCMCQRGGIEMYVAKHRLYVVKRMPDTGHQHHATCVSYEPERRSIRAGRTDRGIDHRALPGVGRTARGFSACAGAGEGVREGCSARTGRDQCAAASDESACRHAFPVRARGIQSLVSGDGGQTDARGDAQVSVGSGGWDPDERRDAIGALVRTRAVSRGAQERNRGTPTQQARGPSVTRRRCPIQDGARSRRVQV